MNNRIIIEVSGGVVSVDHANAPVEVILVDWDNIKEGDDIYTLDLPGVPDRVFNERLQEIAAEVAAEQVRPATPTPTRSPAGL